MSALHTIHNGAALAQALPRSGDDPLLLLEDGVYAAAHQGLKGRIVYALREDVAARGLAAPQGVMMVSMKEFVALAVKHAPIVAWY